MIQQPTSSFYEAPAGEFILEARIIINQLFSHSLHT